MDWATFSQLTSDAVLTGWIKDHVTLIAIVGAIPPLVWKVALLVMRAKARRTESKEDDERVAELEKDVNRFYDEVKGLIPSSIKPPQIRK